MQRRRALLALPVATVLALTAACTTTLPGSGTRVGPTGVGDFPTSSTAAASPGPGGSASAPSSASASASASTSAGASDDPDARDLFTRMVHAMESTAGGYTVKGTFEEDDGSTALDLRVQDGSGQGTFVLDGHACQLVGVGGTAWANAPAAFWDDEGDVADDVVGQIADKWVELTGDIEYLSEFVDQPGFIDSLTSEEDHLTLGPTGTVAGLDVRQVKGDTGTYSISTQDTPLLLEAGDGTGTIDFTFPDDPLQVAPPPADQVVPYPG